MLVKTKLVESSLSDNIVNFLNQDKIANLNIFEILENSSAAKIYVDSLDKPTGVLVNDGYFNYVYTKDDKFIDVMLNQFFSEVGEYGFSGVESKMADKIISKHNVEWRNKCDLYYYDEESVDTSKISSNVKSIDIRDADMINDFYTYKSENSIYSIIECIKNRSTSGVYIDGDLVSWVMVHEDGSMGIMYTKKEFRNKGYAVDVTIDLLDKLLKENKIPFLHIVEDNMPSHKLAKKCGLKLYGKCTWFGIIIQ
ncbi:GNAT family N-acetyltransferase [Romboutsia weinsteinii]|uniref:GNAT family N-acetyltransferase n=1 Tax=Romboutsia weinsteinii TaxID=2020949 RepID=A0A371J5T1_9FIRM|nr:GNAT family N-acetyltransferase [Romboutsia weinsteinii]RDY28026.1 GNAT family N-acetyltransferase [Romboutsia weinsteinii]